MKKKDKIIKKLKSQLGIKDGEGNVEEAKEEGPLPITQGIGEDAEMAEQEIKEEAKKTPTKEKKRKATTPPKQRPQKKQAKLSPAKPNTRVEASTRVVAQKGKGKGKEKAKEKEIKGEEPAKENIKKEICGYSRK